MKSNKGKNTFFRFQALSLRTQMQEVLLSTTFYGLFQLKMVGKKCQPIRMAKAFLFYKFNQEKNYVQSL